ncbi:helix-turn-helix transcriptional regulator [Oscillatoria sp. FACHB-1406]|uniref:helix-turn-helix domain-containing protein n=1 Tax=Oscillatoria sp. FACHB-1406 TaxID=2692846 RepID=UPI001686FC13|nr:helix-turn-helix transcriptional regulator [Oscillatoria sp. FACHB-1406]MBD2578336.1 helix-turn-helix transcriptional regulator [Oscillatoria sp. FACHB-1406]
MGRAGEALKQVLDEYGISQNRLAVVMGVGRSNVHRWVSGTTDPAAEAVLEIRKGLQKIDSEAAIEFIRLYLDDRSSS